MYRHWPFYNRIRRLFSPRVRPRSAAPRRRHYRLEIELLEDRTLLDAGGLDLAFGGDGMVATSFGNANEQVRALAVQEDGKIVAVGWEDNSYDFALARYNTDGSLDASFGDDGQVTTAFGTFDVATSVALQTDGKIVVAGYSYSGGHPSFALARYNTDGSLDTTFDGDGKITTSIGYSSTAYSLAVQDDGKIVVAGTSGAWGNLDFALARYNTDGSLDTTFDGDGTLTTDDGFGGDNQAYSLALQDDGKIVIAGYSHFATTYAYSLARYNTDGSLDASFDGDGLVTTALTIDDSAYSMAIQADGKIVAAGTSFVETSLDEGQYVFSLARYNSDGSLDSTFDGDGLVLTPVGAVYDSVAGLAFQTDGKIIAAGFTFDGENDDFALARYNTDGSLDASFDFDGIVTTNFGGNDNAISVVLQTDGKIVVAGSAPDGTGYNFALARYESADTPDTPPVDGAPTETEEPPPASTTDDSNIVRALLLSSPDQVETSTSTSSEFYTLASDSSIITFSTSTDLSSSFGTTFTELGPLSNTQQLSGTSSTGVISGSVYSTTNDGGTGNSLPGVTLVLEVERDGVFVPVATTVTDQDGQYSFTGLPAGNYRVRPAALADASISITGGTTAPVPLGDGSSSLMPGLLAPAQLGDFFSAHADPVEQFYEDLGRALVESPDLDCMEQPAVFAFDKPEYVEPSSSLLLTAAVLLAADVAAALARERRFDLQTACSR